MPSNSIVHRQSIGKACVLYTEPKFQQLEQHSWLAGTIYLSYVVQCLNMRIALQSNEARKKRRIVLFINEGPT